MDSWFVMRGNGLFVILFLVTLLYVFLSVRDAWSDVRFVFDRRLVRRFLQKFTIAQMLSATALIAGFFALARFFQLPVSSWPFLLGTAGFVFGTVCLLWVAFHDFITPIAKRKHREQLSLDQDAGSATAQEEPVGLPRSSVVESLSPDDVSIRQTP